VGVHPCPEKVPKKHPVWAISFRKRGGGAETRVRVCDSRSVAVCGRGVAVNVYRLEATLLHIHAIIEVNKFVTKLTNSVELCTTREATSCAGPINGRGNSELGSSPVP
jgi:hypothetical protein